VWLGQDESAFLDRVAPFDAYMTDDDMVVWIQLDKLVISTMALISPAIVLLPRRLRPFIGFFQLGTIDQTMAQTCE
jgi:hypothetical protein